VIQECVNVRTFLRMKLLVVTLLALCATIAPGLAAPEKKAEPKTSIEEKKKEADPKTSVDAKTEKEVLAMEERLRAAIEKCDEAVLKEILADYYADALVGSEKAITKAGTIARCKNGKLFCLALGEKKEFQRSAEMIIIEGTASARQTEVMEAKGEKPEMFHVQRRWTKKDGKWLLVMQQRSPIEENEREKSREQPK
jgi:hypothetical protein